MAQSLHHILFYETSKDMCKSRYVVSSFLQKRIVQFCFSFVVQLDVRLNKTILGVRFAKYIIFATYLLLIS